MTIHEEQNKLIEIDPEMTQMAELVERPLEVILTIFPMFKKLE